MTSGRISAFTDGIVAILITVMVLNLRIPKGPNWSDLFDMSFIFLTYLASFYLLAIYWNNHHHLFHLAEKVSGKILWWNIMLLFFMSFIPFTTNWLSEYSGSKTPEILYAVNNLAIDIIFNILSYEIFKSRNYKLKDMRWVWKGGFSILILVIGIILTILLPVAQISLIATILSMIPWIIPDKQIESYVNKN
ncbi:TMEM175 family protein [Lactococcus garvieae]|jgi:uncharacterized membrane protein|uniref:Integral membrane protein n=1 Tax=Lactococcus garvieae DCC43 TaxID=1231377 RepID=K2PLG9_9LACT|nr:TMEM175 family protein [Lactococcus garvieae]EKF52160.1 Protein of unknown function DUF1211 [Lactococcus garvieae DCC43]QPS71692.1 DUF1211 domain-containing protein [Lactococcus garvieae]